MTPEQVSTPEQPAAGPAPADLKPVWVRRALRATGALVTMGVVAWGALLLANHLDERRDVADNVAARQQIAGAPPHVASMPEDPRMRMYLDTPVNWSPVRLVKFGEDLAYFSSGLSQVHPNKMFHGIADGFSRAADTPEARAAAKQYEGVPAVTKLWRLHMHMGQLHGIAFFLHAPPDLAAARAGTLKTEPGGLILGFQKNAGWEYITFFFPAGLNLDAYLRQFGPAPQALRELGPEVGRHLVPTLALGSGGTGLTGATSTKGARTVFCKAVGRSDEALKRTVAALKRRGWESRLPPGAKEQPGRHVLGSPQGELWITASDLNQVGGLITVLLDVR